MIKADQTTGTKPPRTRRAGLRLRWAMLIAFCMGWIVLISEFPNPESILLHVGCLWTAGLLVSYVRRPRPMRTTATLMWLVAAIGFGAAGIAQTQVAIDAAWTEVRSLREQRLGVTQDGSGPAPHFTDVAAAAQAIKERSYGWGQAVAYLATQAGHPEIADDYLDTRGQWCGYSFGTMFGGFDYLGFSLSNVDWELGLGNRIDRLCNHIIVPALSPVDRAAFGAK